MFIDPKLNKEAVIEFEGKEYMMYERIEEGLYYTHLNFHCDIDEKVEPYPTLYDYNIPGYGVCDSVEQWKEAYYDILKSSYRKYVIAFVEIYREDEPPRDGWRWHKWGPYIGNYKIQYEYLYNETIDKIVLFHVYEIL
jgi:hypothetical protein